MVVLITIITATGNKNSKIAMIKAPAIIFGANY